MDLEKEIELLKARNARVETDNDWADRWTRRFFISRRTYNVFCT